MFRQFVVPLVVIAAFAASPAVSRQSPQAVLDELLATERSLSEAASKLSPAEGIASLIAKDGVLYTRPAPVNGPEAALAALKANPANNGKFAKWRSIQVGVSADGQHGFTLGYLDIEGGNPATAKRRYLAYWTRGADRWRVAVMKQVGQSDKDQYAPTQPPALPARIVRGSPAQIPAYRETLIAAEKAFSDRAQIVGQKQAFQEYGRPDATHIFGVTGFSMGLAAIKANHDQQPGTEAPSQSEWSADRAIVASSGDMGVTFGYIRRHKPIVNPPPGAPTGPTPFFTIWRRDDPSQPWKYIAE